VVDKKNRTWHTANGLPIYASYDRYECRHGLGYTTYVYEKDGIEGRLTVFVPVVGNFEQWIVTLTNRRNTEAELGVIAYCATNVDGDYEKQGYNSMEGHFDPEARAICHRFATKFGTGKRDLNYAYMTADAPVAAYDCRHNAFIGTYGHKDAPQALIENLGCTNSDCIVEKLCFAMEHACTLAPGASQTVRYQIGHAFHKEEIADLRRYLSAGVPEALLGDVIAKRAEECGGVTVRTPDERLNLAFNSFYKYSTVMGSHWARVRHNGYRDMTNDTECLATFHPTLAWERLKRVLAWQYSTGYATRTIKDGKIQDNNYVDCAVWLPSAAHTLITELGDPSLLREEIPFNDGSTATVFEHLRRAMQYLYDFHGENGLIKIWGGDWHDGLNWAGLKGKGVSIWLSIAWYRANKLFVELAEMLGESEIASKHTEMGKQMRANVEEHGWDGSYYLEAITDEGVKIGSKESKALKMWLVPNVWAVLAEIAPREKLLGVMEEVDKTLDSPFGTLNATPAWRGDCDDKIGNLTRQPAGTLLNESIYMQPMTWKLMAEAILKRRDAMQTSLKKFLPWDHTYGDTQGEPYILYNYYAGAAAGYRAGIPGQSWRTATAHCFVRFVVRYLYGLVPTLEGLSLDPCLPPEWRECSITKNFRGAVYEITYRQAENGSGTIDRILVNGLPHAGRLLPCDGKSTYQVEVLLK
jgi:cellobiose phosphorylase